VLDFSFYSSDFHGVLLDEIWLWVWAAEVAARLWVWAAEVAGARGAEVAASEEMATWDQVIDTGTAQTPSTSNLGTANLGTITIIPFYIKFGTITIIPFYIKFRALRQQLITALKLRLDLRLG
jgi:hypothetical protein